MVSDSNFWKLISEDKYPNIWTTVARFNAFFGSKYLCESAFSYIYNAIKTKQCTVVCNAKFLEINLQVNTVKEEVLPSLSLKNGTSRSILRGPSGDPKWTTSCPQKL